MWRSVERCDKAHAMKGVWKGMHATKSIRSVDGIDGRRVRGLLSLRMDDGRRPYAIELPGVEEFEKRKT